MTRAPADSPTLVTAQPILDGWWRAYTVDDKDPAISASYQAHYGRPPEKIVRYYTVTLAGPVPDELAPKAAP